MIIHTTELVKRIIVIKPTGRIDAFTAEPLKNELNAQVDRNNSDLVVDLSDVTFMDSAGMAILVNALKRTRAVGGDTRLVWPTSADGRRILNLTKFDRVFTMLDSTDNLI
jgi:anti-sigma B factor antagonist